MCHHACVELKWQLGGIGFLLPPSGSKAVALNLPGAVAFNTVPHVVTTATHHKVIFIVTLYCNVSMCRISRMQPLKGLNTPQVEKVLDSSWWATPTEPSCWPRDTALKAEAGVMACRYSFLVPLPGTCLMFLNSAGISDRCRHRQGHGL